MTSSELAPMASPQTHFSDLRPLSMGRIFDQAIRLYRRNFARFLGIAVIAQIPAALSSFLTLSVTTMPFGTNITSEMTEPMAVGTSFLIMGLSLVAMVWTQLVGCVLVQNTSDTYLGRLTTLSVAFRRAGRSWMAVIAALLLLMVIGIVVVIIFVIPIVGWLLAIPGFGMFIYFSTVVVSMLTPTIVLEKLSARRGISRAWSLARTRFWWLFGFFLLLTLFALLITQGPTYLLAGIVALVGEGLLELETIWIIAALISVLFGVIFYPIQIACATLVYYNTRVQHEGLDLALQTVALEKENPSDGDNWDAVDHVIQHPPADGQRFRPTGGEWGAFSLITLGLVGLAIVLFGVFFMIGLFAPVAF